MTALLINVQASIFNAVSNALWFVNWRIWFLLMHITHQRLGVVELRYNLVSVEEWLMFVVVAVLASIAVRRMEVVTSDNR